MSELDLKKALNRSNDIKKNVKYILGYVAGIMFFFGLVVYLYMIIIDYLESGKHTDEETAWIYGLLFILIIGFISSFYLIFKK
jgi:O-antigen/teichoic acid export membrane protein